MNALFARHNIMFTDAGFAPANLPAAALPFAAHVDTAATSFPAGSRNRRIPSDEGMFVAAPAIFPNGPANIFTLACAGTCAGTDTDIFISTARGLPNRGTPAQGKLAKGIFAGRIFAGRIFARNSFAKGFVGPDADFLSGTREPGRNAFFRQGLEARARIPAPMPQPHGAHDVFSGEETGSPAHAAAPAGKSRGGEFSDEKALDRHQHGSAPRER